MNFTRLRRAKCEAKRRRMPNLRPLRQKKTKVTKRGIHLPVSLYNVAVRVMCFLNHPHTLRVMQGGVRALSFTVEDLCLRYRAPLVPVYHPIVIPKVTLPIRAPAPTYRPVLLSPVESPRLAALTRLAIAESLMSRSNSPREPGYRPSSGSRDPPKEVVDRSILNDLEIVKSQTIKGDENLGPKIFVGGIRIGKPVSLLLSPLLLSPQSLFLRSRPRLLAARTWSVISWLLSQSLSHPQSHLLFPSLVLKVGLLSSRGLSLPVSLPLASAHLQLA
jgi:hypothetical protein